MAKNDIKHSKRSQSSDFAKNVPQKSDASLTPYLIDASWRVAIPLLAFSFLGIWLDGIYETKPLLSLVGVFVGIAATVASMYRFLQDNFPETLDMLKGKDTEDQR